MKNLLTLFYTFSIVSLFAQTNIYVATTGSDASGNGTIGNPYATIAKAADVANNPSSPVNIWVRGGTYRNSGFTTTTIIDPSTYSPETVGEAIWKQNSTTGTAVRLNNINGTAANWITIQAYTGEQPLIECDGDVAFSIRNCSYLRVQGFEIKGVLDLIPKQTGWKYWGTYRYLVSGSYVYGDRKTDICNTHSISPCTDIPPNVFTAHETYSGLPNINSLNVERPNIFGGKGLLVQLSHHIDILDNEIYNFPGGGLRGTSSDFLNFRRNSVHHNTSRSSVGTHGLVLEGLEPDSGNNLSIEKAHISENTVYSNYNEIYSWVQSKTIATVSIDEGKGICLLRTSPAESGFNGIIRVENNIAYDNGKSGIHTNDVNNAEIINNTVYNNAHTNIFDAAISGGTNAGISIQSSNDIKIINNIAVVQDGLSPALQALSEGQNCSGEIVSNNIVFGGGSNDFAGGFTTTDPQFTNMAANDVSLQSTSPAINAGTSSHNPPTTDFSGATRMGLPDIGAYESSSVLSVALLDFSLQNVGTSIRLEWATSREINHRQFEIERSENGQQWAKIGTVKGANNSQSKKEYTFLDSSPLQGTSYYRLQQIDQQGKYDYSKVLMAFLGERTKKNVFPNPFTDILHLNGLKNNERVSIYDLQGKLLYDYQTIKSENMTLNLSFLGKNSIYILKVGEEAIKIKKM